MIYKASFLIAMALTGTVIVPGSAHADRLCPDTTKIGDVSIGDASDLQFDIDRLGLCLQRARLLQQIDEVVKKRETIRQEPMSISSMGMGSGMGGSMGGGNGLMIPPMPSPPDLPAQRNAVPAAMPIMAADKPPAASVEWKIQRIWGQGDTTQAQLAKDTIIANVKLNDILPTGEKVVDLSGRGVTLDNGKTRRPLNWLENGKKDTGKGADSGL